MYFSGSVKQFCSVSELNWIDSVSELKNSFETEPVVGQFSELKL